MNDEFVTMLQRVIRLGVRILAILMTLVIFWSIVDVGYLIITQIMSAPVFLIDIQDILGIFGAFMSVLIAIEIFENIILYLQDEVIHIKIVMATALMAISRKVIIIDFNTVDSGQLIGTGVILFALSVGYWFLIEQKPTVRRAKMKGLKKFFGMGK